MSKDTLAEFELLVILAALRLGPKAAYTVSIADVIEEKTGRRVRRANVHTALRRLETRGLVSTKLGGSRPERGGKRRRLVDVRPEGITAIQNTKGAIEALSEGLEEAIGGAA